MTDQSKTFSVASAIRSYLPLMHELAERIQLVANVCEGKANIDPVYAREFSYLQFRRMCELIALGCLQLHGDLPITQTQSAQKEWHAEKIMKLLHKSYPHSFPQPINREVTPDGINIRANEKPNALTLDLFKALYNECGEVLHVGTIRSLKTAQPLKTADFEKILDWQRRIVHLMNEHIVGRAHDKGFYMISLRTDSGYPECTFFSPNDIGGLSAEVFKMNRETR